MCVEVTDEALTEPGYDAGRIADPRAREIVGLTGLPTRDVG